MNTIEYWVVEEGYDRSNTVIGCFTSETVANQIAGGKNNAYRSVFKKTLTLFDSAEDFENNTREKIRERALAKLTVEEKTVLGIR